MKHNSKITYRFIEIFYFDSIKMFYSYFSLKIFYYETQCIIVFTSHEINHQLKMEVLFQFFSQIYIFSFNSRDTPVKCSYFNTMASFTRESSVGKDLVSCKEVRAVYYTKLFEKELVWKSKDRRLETRLNKPLLLVC